MTTSGWNVARFWNGCVLQDRERVLETIVEIVEHRLIQEVRSLISPLFRLKGQTMTDDWIHFAGFSNSESV